MSCCRSSLDSSEVSLAWICSFVVGDFSGLPSALSLLVVELCVRSSSWLNSLVRALDLALDRKLTREKGGGLSVFQNRK